MTKPYAIAQESVYSLTSDHFFMKWITGEFKYGAKEAELLGP